MKKLFNRFTYNEKVFLFVVVASILLKTIIMVPVWMTDYQFWKINGYSKEGTMPMNQSSLMIPKEQGIYYCMDMKALSGKSAFKDTISVGGIHKPHCGCLGLEDNAVVKYKLLKDKIVYQCRSEILITQHIPASLEKS